MSITRIIIDTDDLRRLAQYTDASLDQLAVVRTDLYRVLSMLGPDIRAATVRELLADIEQLGAVMVQDRRALLDEVAALEASDGVVGADAAFRAGQVAPSAIGSSALEWLVEVVAGAHGPTATPAPWNEGWQTADGLVDPAGGFTTPQWRDASYTGDQVSLATDRALGDERAGPIAAKKQAAIAAKQQAAAAAEGQALAAAEKAQARAAANAGGPLWGSAAVRTPGFSASIDGRFGSGDTARVDGSVGTIGNSLQARGAVSLGKQLGGEIQAHADTPLGAADAQASGDVALRGGAQASASVGLGGVGGSAGAGGYAGAEVGGVVHVQGPAGVSAGVGLDGRLGVGVEVSASGELSADHVGFSFDLGGALGIGGGVHLDLGFSPSALGSGALDLISNPGGTLGKVWDGAKDAGSDVGDLFKGSTWEHPSDRPVPPPGPPRAPRPLDATSAGSVPAIPPTPHGDATGAASRFVGDAHGGASAPWPPVLH